MQEKVQIDWVQAVRGYSNLEWDESGNFESGPTLALIPHQ